MKAVECLAQNLDAVMKMHGITSQHQLFHRTGVSQAHIGNILHQRQAPGLKIIERLAASFGLEAWQLLGPPELLHPILMRQLLSLCDFYLQCGDGGRAIIYQVARAQAQIPE